MRNIQDLKGKIFFESKNIIDNLDKIHNVDELLSKQDLVDELANRISFLRLLEKNIEYFISEQSLLIPENDENVSFATHDFESHDSNNYEVTEEEAIFNNELNEIEENDEEVIFTNQVNKIVENELYESFVNVVGENNENELIEGVEVDHNEEKAINEIIFNDHLSQIDEEKIQDHYKSDENNQEEIIQESIDKSQLHEISDNVDDFEEESKKEASFESEVKNEENNSNIVLETIPSIFDEDTEDHFIDSNSNISQGEFVSDTSNVDPILNEIKSEDSIEESPQEIYISEVSEKETIVEMNTIETELKEIYSSDEHVENAEEYHQEGKIKLANIKGLKGIQTLFDDLLERESSSENRQESLVKEDTETVLNTTIQNNFTEGKSIKPEFKLDLNDRIAFSKMLFGGSQSELNEVVSVLNRFENIEEAKEYLSDLYYERKWSKVDEYAQRLWILVENKFL